MMGRKFPKTKDEVPSEPRWAILKPNHTYVPGDERSRTNPGHGYPAHTVKAWDYIVYDDKQEWEAEVARLTRSKSGYERNFVAIRAIPAKISTEVRVTID